VSFEWVVPQNAVTIFPQAKIAFDPTVADFDDLSLKVKETGEELLTNGDLEQFEMPTLKDAQRLARLRKFVKEGRVEIVGGAYTQPIMFTIGDESVVRQFVLGCKAVEEAMVVQHAEGFAQPLAFLPATSKTSFEVDEFSLVKVEPENSVAISAVYPSRDGVVVRLWRPYEGVAKVRVQISGAKSVWLADLFGKPQKQLARGEAATIEFKCGEIVTLLATN
jgi:hypothetical protein